MNAPHKPHTNPALARDIEEVTRRLGLGTFTDWQAAGRRQVRRERTIAWLGFFVGALVTALLFGALVRWELI